MYYLKRKIKAVNLNNPIKVDGLDAKSKKIKKVTIVDKKLRSKYATKQMDNKLKKLYDKIFNFLTSDDDSENGVKACLGEIEKIKAILFNKYKNELQNKKYKEYLAKIAITEEEFKNKFEEREYYKELIEKMYRDLREKEELEEMKGKAR